MSDASNQEKREKMNAFLDEGMVLIQLDSRIDEVEVPDYLRGDAKLRLNISGRFGLPLDIDDWGVHATLTFRGSPFACKIPWYAIYIIISHSSGEPQLFPDDIPAEFVADALGTTYGEESPETDAPVPHLRLVESTAEADTPAEVVAAEPARHADPEEPTEPPESDPPGGPSGHGRRGHLSVVK